MRYEFGWRWLVRMVSLRHIQDRINPEVLGSFAYTGYDSIA
jgi:hypothetical protein